MGYYEDSGQAARDKKPAKTPLVGKTNAKQAAFYRKQREQAEAGEKRGNVAATREAAKIHQKTGRALTGAEGDLTLKPGASEDEQRGNVFNAISGTGIGSGIGRRIAGGIADAIPRVMSSVGERAVPRAVEKTAARAGAGAAKRAAAMGKAERAAKGAGSGKPISVGRERPKALGPGKPNERRVQALVKKGRSIAGKGSDKPMMAGKGGVARPGRVSSRAAGRTPRSSGTNPRAVKAGAKAEEPTFKRLSDSEADAAKKRIGGRADAINDKAGAIRKRGGTLAEKLRKKTQARSG